MGLRKRRLGCDDGTVLIACSICGNAFRYPTEIRRCSDKLWRCNVYCTETTNQLSESMKEAASQRSRNPNEQSVPLPGAIKPSWSP